MLKYLAILSLALFASAAAANPLRDLSFASIDGGEVGFADWEGQPVLVVNTASLCAYTPQYAALQDLWESYRDRGLVVFAVPSDDFAQELESAEEVKEFCELTFGLDLPMADITRVRGPSAHPFYAWLQETEGFRPRWNFNKVLIGPDGQFVEAWGSRVQPMSRQITEAVEALLPG